MISGCGVFLLLLSIGWRTSRVHDLKCVAFCYFLEQHLALAPVELFIVPRYAFSFAVSSSMFTFHKIKVDLS